MTDPRKILEQAVTLSEELRSRQADDSLLNFRPHNGQKPFIESVLGGKVPENWLIAANRSGKSDAGAYCGAMLARFGRDSGKLGVYEKGRLIVTDRATAGWVSALDFPTSRDVIQPKYFDNGVVPPGATHQPFIPKREIASWKVSDQILRLKNGSIIGFKSADSGREKYQGAEKDWIHFDEEHEKPIYEEAVIRVGGSPLTIFGTVTLLPPEGTTGGVSWIFEDKIEPFQRGELKNVGLFGASIYDNPHIPPSEIERLEAIYPEGSVQRRIRLGGEWLPGLGGARAYVAFDQRLHVRPQPDINLRRPLCWIWDFNVEPMVSLIGQRHGLLFRVFRELIMEEGNIPEMCEMFRQIHPVHWAPIFVYGDATGRHRHAQSNLTNYTIILNEMMTSRTPIELKVPESNPPITDRVNAVNYALRSQQGETQLLIDPSCRDLIADLKGVLRDKQGKIKKTFNRKDPYFRRTHTSDALGYWIAYVQPVVPARTRERRPTLVTPDYGSRRRNLR